MCLLTPPPRQDTVLEENPRGIESGSPWTERIPPATSSTPTVSRPRYKPCRIGRRRGQRDLVGLEVQGPGHGVGGHDHADTPPGSTEDLLPRGGSIAVVGGGRGRYD